MARLRVIGVMAYQSGLFGGQTLAGLVETDETGTATSVYRHAGTSEIVCVGNSIGHDRRSIARCGILGGVFGVTETDLLIVWQPVSFLSGDNGGRRYGRAHL